MSNLVGNPEDLFSHNSNDYCYCPMFSDTNARVNSLDPNQTARQRAVSSKSALFANIAEVSKAHIPPAVANRGHTTLIGKWEKSTNKRTDKQYVAEFSIHSTTCHS